MNLELHTSFTFWHVKQDYIVIKKHNIKRRETVTKPISNRTFYTYLE